MKPVDVAIYLRYANPSPAGFSSIKELRRPLEFVPKMYQLFLLEMFYMILVYKMV